MRTSIFVFVIALAASAAACSTKEGGKATAKPVTSADALQVKLLAAGLQLGTMAPVEVAALSGGTCKRGEASGVEVTLCEYPDAARAKKLEAVALDIVGDTTGSALAEGKLLLVVADRKNVDKDGKRIDTITRAFRGR
jgi:hypothetical protein